MNRRILVIAALALFALGAALLAGATPARAASIVVTGTGNTVAADGLCTLREAVLSANNNASPNVDCANGSGADTITFSVTGTITLSGTLFITSPLTISGPGAGSLTVSGNNANRVFLVSGNPVTISGLTITGGNTGGTGGGGIRNTGTLTVTNSTISGNSTSNGGGGINNSAGTLTVTNSTISGNTATGGGGILNSGTLTVTNSTISGNTVSSGGGGIWNSGTLTVTGSLFSGNIGPNAAGIYNDGGGSVSASCIESNTTTLGTSYDVARPVGATTFNGNWWGVATGPNTGGETFGPGAVASFLSARPACGATAAGGGGGTADVCDDGRINCRAGDDYVVIYPAHDNHGDPALHFYCLTVDGIGNLAGTVTQGDLDALPEPSTSNIHLTTFTSANGCRTQVAFWVLTTGEYQIVIGPDHKGDMIRIIFNGLPPSGVYVRRCNVVTSPALCNS